jgi:hypothetical protein
MELQRQSHGAEEKMATRSSLGAGLMVAAGALGAAAAIHDYYDAASGIDGTGGVELVIASCLLMIFGALLLMVLGRGLFARIFQLLLVLDVIGTGVAGYFLESGQIMSAMALAAIGWLLQFKADGRAG